MEQTVDRTEMPPTPIIPGFQVVARSAGRKAPMSPGGEIAAWALPDLVCPQIVKPMPAIIMVIRIDTRIGRGVRVGFM
jgi:hypothetical protein